MRSTKISTVLYVSLIIVDPRQASSFLAPPVQSSRSIDGVHTWSRRDVPHALTMLGSTSNVHINKDVVVVGGGLAGLSTALELAKRGRQVTVLSRDRGEAAAEAAGGMIAPQAERLESGPYLDLCLTSRAMYADWVSSIEAIAGLGGEKAETHFWSSGGFLSPAFEGDTVHAWSPPPEAGQSHWVNRDQALEMEPSLSPNIVGAWWYPQDMSIDAQRMFRVLELACNKAGVEILQGTAAASLVYGSEGSSVDAVLLEDGRHLHVNAVVSATGAWMRELMPVPMLPHKGQMMSLREPVGGQGKGSPQQGGGIGLTRVFFAAGCYIIPKRDGRIVVGSTVEVGEYGLHNTPAGMKQIIDAAIKVCPAIANLAIERTWAGLRPVTPDTFPVLGASSRCANLFVAGGYWRNGVLLAPKTAQLVADAVCGCMSVQDEEFARAFAMDRFTVPPREARHSGTEHRHEVRASASAEASPSELLEMERAALEGANDGSMLSDLSGLFGKPPVAEEKAEAGPDVAIDDPARASAVNGAVNGEAVNDYDASERFSESNLKEARMANRLLEERSDSRLEALFGDRPEEEAIPIVKAWDDGAEEVAKMIGAQMVEMDVDVPEGVSPEDFLSQSGPFMKVFVESPSGEDIEVPRGMNLASMVEEGLIQPFSEDRAVGDGADDTGRKTGTSPQQNAPGVFNPAAVKGKEERNAEVDDLYTKVLANKARAKVQAGQVGIGEGARGGGDVGKPGVMPVNGHVQDKSNSEAGKSSIGNIVGTLRASGEEQRAALMGEPSQDDNQSGRSGHQQERKLEVGADINGSSRASRPEETGGGQGEEAEDMVGYDFIMQDRGDQEGQAAKSARTSTRDAPEGQAAWDVFEDIASAATASMGGMDAIEYLPP